MAFYPYGSDDYWTNLGRMANYAQLWFVMMEAEDLRNSELAAMLGDQNKDFLEAILSNQIEMKKQLDSIQSQLDILIKQNIDSLEKK